MTTACGECTSTVITVSENQNNVQMNTVFTVTIAAVNLCGETGPTAAASYTLSKLPLLNEREHKFSVIWEPLTQLYRMHLVIIYKHSVLVCTRTKHTSIVLQHFLYKYMYYMLQEEKKKKLKM